MLEILITALIAGALTAPAAIYGIYEEYREVRKEKESKIFRFWINQL